MKCSFLVKLLFLGVVLAVGAVGCKKPQKGVTPITAASRTGQVPQGGIKTDLTGGGSLGSGDATGDVTGAGRAATPGSDSGFEQGDIALIEGMIPDAAYFRAQTVYFDFDSSVVKSTEQDRVNFVGDEMKAKAGAKLMIDGHCDERGTEEYNRSLGERRALAIREYLIRYGVAAERVFTRTFGEDVPADPGQNEAAYRLNRRGEFILLQAP